MKMKTYKCDKCGEYYDVPPVISVTDVEILKTVPEHNGRELADLCTLCNIKLQNWWRNVNEDKAI